MSMTYCGRMALRMQSLTNAAKKRAKKTLNKSIWIVALVSRWISTAGRFVLTSFRRDFRQSETLILLEVCKKPHPTGRSGSRFSPNWSQGCRNFSSPLMHGRGVGMWYEARAAAGFVHAGAADGDSLF